MLAQPGITEVTAIVPDPGHRYIVTDTIVVIVILHLAVIRKMSDLNHLEMVQLRRDEMQETSRCYPIGRPGNTFLRFVYCHNL